MQKRVFIVDDDAIILRIAALHLRQAGYRVVTTSNPLMMAMELGTHEPDLVLLDVEMPAIRGTEVLGALRRTSCHDAVKIVLFSSLSESVLEQLSSEFSATGWIRKASPLNGASLVARVAEILDEGTSSKPKALVADDSRTMRRILTGALTEQGFSVLHAGDGGEVCRLLEREERLDLVLVDVNMPEVEGEELVRRLRNHPTTRQAQILLVTCESDRALVERVLRAGADRCLRKPFTRAELSGTIRELLEVPRAIG